MTSTEHSTIRTVGGEPTGTFRVYDGDTFIGYVLTTPKPGEGPHWTRPLGRQGRTASGTVAEWAEDKAGAIAALVAAYRAEIQPAEPFSGIGVGITDTCGLCRKPFDLLYPPDQYPTVTVEGEMPELICDTCQDEMDAASGDPEEAYATARAENDFAGDWMANDEAYAEAAYWHDPEA